MSKSHTHPDNFVRRHIGPAPADINVMLKELGYTDLSSFSKAIIPQSILNDKLLAIPKSLSESEALLRLKTLASENKIFRNYLW